MKSIKEKIETFKKLETKQKVSKIINWIFVTILIIMTGIIIIGGLIKTKVASADNRPIENISGMVYPESPEIELPKLELGRMNTTTILRLETGRYNLGSRKNIMFETFVASDSNPWKCWNIVQVNIYGDSNNPTIELIEKTNEAVVMQMIIFRAENYTEIQEIYVLRENGQFASFGNGQLQEVRIARLIGGAYSTYEMEDLVKLLWACSYSKIYGEWFEKGYNYYEINEGSITQEMLNEAYNNGYEKGEQTGYNNGYSEGAKNGFNPIGMIINPVAQFFSIPMFGNFAIGDFFTVALFVSVALIFLRIFAGG